MVFLPGPVHLNFAQNEAIGGLSSLGVNPLGGVTGEAGPVPSSPVQVALGSPTTPVFNGLVSLITLTQVISVNREGERIETAVNLLEQPVVDASEGPRPDLPVEVALTIDQPDSPDHGTVMIDHGERRGLTSNDPVPLGREIQPRVADAGVDRAELEPLAGIGVTRLVITGVIISAAFCGRRAIRDLKWRRRACAERPRLSGPIGRRISHDSATVTRPPNGMGCALPHELGRAVQTDGSSRSRVAR